MVLKNYIVLFFKRYILTCLGMNYHDFYFVSQMVYEYTHPYIHIQRENKYSQILTTIDFRQSIFIILFFKLF